MSTAAATETNLGVLFEPQQLGSLRLPNRIVMAPMGTSLDRDGQITDEAIAYYVRRAQGGVGTITVEGCLVSPDNEGPGAEDQLTGVPAGAHPPGHGAA